uniref:Ig-like domain-containing protein n=1 Tax=Gadus morhua TaxID=8049 RepID=A0A8C5ATR7_GADMO
LHLVSCTSDSFLLFLQWDELFMSIFSAMIDTKEGPHIVSLQIARLGDDVTLHCGDRKESRFIHWYKQSIGYVPQKVATIVGDDFSQIFDSRFTAAEPDMNLNIRSVSKEDEANYFCQEHHSKNWKSGFFLSVKGKISLFYLFSILSSESSPIIYFFSVLKMIILFHCSDPNDQRFVSQTVVQQPVSASAQLGDPVALQCSITSQRTDHSNQCQGEPSVYWFRSGPSHPANSSGPPSAPQSCVYTLPKNNVDSSDAGTYYCALAACGEVVFGNGTQLDIPDNRHIINNLFLFPANMVLGILLACCLVVIIILLLTRNKKQVCEHCKGLYFLNN